MKTINKNITTMAKAIFYKNNTDCTLAVPNDKGGTTFLLFDTTSQLVNYCRDNGISATAVLED